MRTRPSGSRMSGGRALAFVRLFLWPEAGEKTGRLRGKRTAGKTWGDPPQEAREFLSWEKPTRRLRKKCESLEKNPSLGNGFLFYWLLMCYEFAHRCPCVAAGNCSGLNLPLLRGCDGMRACRPDCQEKSFLRAGASLARVPMPVWHASRLFFEPSAGMPRMSVCLAPRFTGSSRFCPSPGRPPVSVPRGGISRGMLFPGLVHGQRLFVPGASGMAFSSRRGARRGLPAPLACANIEFFA